MACYLNYTEEFQHKVINAKKSDISVKGICKNFNISIYTLYKILHMNGEMPTPSQVSEGNGSEEGLEHSDLSPNNNDHHERPASTWKNYGERHKKIEQVCLRCGDIFSARDRGDRVKFCSPTCKSKYQTEQNLGRISSKMSRQIHSWLKEVFEVENEKTFSWFYDINKPKGRFRLDFFLPKYNLGIEYDGEQHFKPSFTSKWESVEKVQTRDKLKEKLCSMNGIKITRFKYDEPITKKSMLMKIYAELQGSELVEVEDKKPLR